MKRINVLFIGLFVFVVNINASVETNYYHPSLETSYKVGNKRQIGRASMLLPIWQKED